MAANTTPLFVDTPHIGMVQISTANTNRDGTGTLGDVFTATTDGSLIYYVRAQAIVTTTAGMVRLYLYDGTNTRLVGEITVSAVTVGASTPGWAGEWHPAKPLYMASTWVLKASTHNAETFNVFAFGADY